MLPGGRAALDPERAGGRPAGSDAMAGTPLEGAVSMLMRRLLELGADPDPDDPPSLDATTTRHVWERYPVRLRVH